MPGAHWPNFAWLFQVSVALVERLAGEWGLLALKAMAWWLIFTLLFRAIGSCGAPLSWIFPALLFSWQLLPSMNLRPHLFEGVFLAVAILLMQKTRGRRYLWLSGGLILLWANTHASVVVGAAALALQWLLGKAFRWPGRRALLLSALVFATPNGLDILGVLLGHAQADYLAAYIREWVPLQAMPPFVFLALLGVLGALLPRQAGHPRGAPADPVLSGPRGRQQAFSVRTVAGPVPAGGRHDRCGPGGPGPAPSTAGWKGRLADRAAAPAGHGGGLPAALDLEEPAHHRLPCDAAALSACGDVGAASGAR